MLTPILLIALVVLFVLLLMKRGNGSRRRGSGGRYYRPSSRSYGPSHFDPRNPPARSQYDDAQPRMGLSGGSFLGGMAAGALLTYLLEQERIAPWQYDYFNGMGEDQMMYELMQQNILQQDEIDDLQRQVYDGGVFVDGMGQNVDWNLDQAGYDTQDNDVDDDPNGYDDSGNGDNWV